MKTVTLTSSMPVWKSGRTLAGLAILLAAAPAILPPVLAADPDVTLNIQAGQPGTEINPAMWGIFFEDINFGGDGGLYAQLVKNGAFEFTNALMGWSNLAGEDGGGLAMTREEDPLNSQSPHYLRLASTSEKGFGLSNEGFRGMGVREGETYDFSTEARAIGGDGAVLRVELVRADGTVIGSAKVSGFTPEWQKHTATLTVNATEPKARLNVIVEGRATLDLDMVSLFPEKTWKNRPGGLRADMVQMLADLKPGFMRFPGGCIVEGSVLERRYQWKNTIGDPEQRKLLIDRWNYEFKHRPTPDYFQSFGLGFFEFFQLCEDIGAQPLPILNCGMACQFNSGQLVPLDQLDPFIQDALDLIEFANGSATSEWGAKRAAMGHPAPFNMKMLGVGNEQWGPQYIERYTLFARALKAKHPEIMLVSAAGPSPADERFNFLWPKLRALKADIVDEHCYANPIWFLANTHRYDNYDRSGPKVFMGEYGAQSKWAVSPDNRNNWDCALAEAAYMTGLERNADVVRMASYAPLFANVDAWQWTPDLIWCDTLRVYGTPNYYVQQLFSRNRGDAVLPVTISDSRAVPPAVANVGVGTFDTSAEFKDVRVTGNQGETLINEDFSGTPDWNAATGNWAVQDGAYRQSSLKGASISLSRQIVSTNYVLTLKARKLAGNEGFIIVVCNDATGIQAQWNLGGWDNKQHGIQAVIGGQTHIIAQIPGHINPGQWYDIKLELAGTHLNCYLDGALLQSAEVPTHLTTHLFATAALDRRQHEVILKVVNAAAQPVEANVNLAGVRLTSPGKALVLASPRLSDENSFDAPKNIAPVEEPLTGTGPAFRRNFPAYSVTVLRLPEEPAAGNTAKSDRADK